jgi:hypothetical protein
MNIPKVIYQTWKTKDINPEVKQVINKMMMINKGYKHEFYDDNDIEIFLKENFPPNVYNCYSRINIGASKADFWRYCVLYKYGGVYIDIDSTLLKPIDDLLTPEVQCLVTREKNPGMFNNWIIACEKEHPIMRMAIDICCLNIYNGTATNAVELTTRALNVSIQAVMMPFYDKITSLYFENDQRLNMILNNPDNIVRCKFFGFDLNDYAIWKHEACDQLYSQQKHWTQETQLLK